MDRGILEHGRVGQQVTAAASDLPQLSKRGVGASIGFGPLRDSWALRGRFAVPGGSPALACTTSRRSIARKADRRQARTPQVM
jgi:hypothetical protein